MLSFILAKPAPIVKEANLSKKTIIIVIISLAVGCILLLVVAALLWRHKSKRDYTNNNKFPFNGTNIEAVHLNLDPNIRRGIKISSGRLSSCHTEKEYISDLVVNDPLWEVDYDNIELRGLLGEGAFGRVMLGVVHGLLGNTEPTVAAVKMLKGKRLGHKIFRYRLTLHDNNTKT